MVTIGFSEQDPVLALGVKPVAVREWFGGHPYAAWPWAVDDLGDAEPTVLTMPFGELDYERIAVLRPDLIVATHSGITEEEYERLSRIAPTWPNPGTTQTSACRGRSRPGRLAVRWAWQRRPRPW